MRYFPLVALVLACAVGVYSIAVKDKEGLAFASRALALAGTAYQASDQTSQSSKRLQQPRDLDS